MEIGSGTKCNVNVTCGNRRGNVFFFLSRFANRTGMVGWSESYRPAAPGGAETTYQLETGAEALWRLPRCPGALGRNESYRYAARLQRVVPARCSRRSCNSPRALGILGNIHGIFLPKNAKIIRCQLPLSTLFCPHDAESKRVQSSSTIFRFVSEILGFF